MDASSDRWISDARAALQRSPSDYFQVKPWRYWLDFLLSMTIAYTAASLYLTQPLGSWPQLIAFPFAVFWLYRTGSLIHEVCHLGQREMRTFKVAWNLAVGVMTLSPSPFFTRHHRDHHSQKMYGTPQDPEYVVNIWRRGNWTEMVQYLGMMLLLPLLVFLRFFLVPLTYLHPRLRQWTLTHASAIMLNRNYVRKLNDYDVWAITAVEWLCWIRATMMLVVVAMGWADWTRLPLLYSLGLAVLVLNQARQLADHHFEGEGEHFSLADHVRDSCNYTKFDMLTSLFFPFSIRYHALHHLFPSMPYHNLAAAHAYLVRELPADSPYRELDEPGWWSTASQMFHSPVRPRPEAAKGAAEIARDTTSQAAF